MKYDKTVSILKAGGRRKIIFRPGRPEDVQYSTTIVVQTTMTIRITATMTVYHESEKKPTPKPKRKLRLRDTTAGKN